MTQIFTQALTLSPIPCHIDFTATKDALNDHTILVTGAGRGIGRAIAHCYAAHGAQVVLLGRTQKHLEQVYDEILEAGHPTPAIIPFNLESTAEQDYAEITRIITDNFGALDGLVHNAGLLGHMSPLAHYPVSSWQKVMQVNVTAPFLLTRALIPCLQQAQRASVVFTSSSVGRVGRAHWGAYSVSKFATEGMMQVLADELANTSRIRVNSINPGATRTQMRADAYPAEDPLTKRCADEIIGTYLYLMCEKDPHMTRRMFDAQPA